MSYKSGKILGTALSTVFTLYAGHAALVHIGTELSLPKDATRIGWIAVNGGHSGMSALEYKTADGKRCLRSGIIDSCFIGKSLGLDQK